MMSMDQNNLIFRTFSLALYALAISQLEIEDIRMEESSFIALSKCKFLNIVDIEKIKVVKSFFFFDFLFINFIDHERCLVRRIG